MQLSQFILEDMEGILQDWEDFARTLPTAASMDRKQLRDHAEKMLRAVARGMDNRGARKTRSQSQKEVAMPRNMMGPIPQPNFTEAVASRRDSRRRSSLQSTAHFGLVSFDAGASG